MDWGRISSAANPHLVVVRNAEPAMPGNTEAYAQLVTPT